ERLYVDGTLLASGGFGRLVELRATIPEGAGAGDQIRATAFAGVFSFGCRIFVAETAVPAQVINPSVAPNAGPDAVPAPLLARGRRGSRWTTFFWFALAIAALVVVGGVDVETGPGEMNLRHDFANLVALALIGNSLFFALRRGPAPSPPVDSPVRRPQAHAATPTPRRWLLVAALLLAPVVIAGNLVFGGISELLFGSVLVPGAGLTLTGLLIFILFVGRVTAKTGPLTPQPAGRKLYHRSALFLLLFFVVWCAFQLEPNIAGYLDDRGRLELVPQ